MSIPEIPAPEPADQAVVLSVGEKQIVLTAFEMLAQGPGTRQEGNGPSIPKRPTSGPDTDPEDGDFY